MPDHFANSGNETDNGSDEKIKSEKQNSSKSKQIGEFLPFEYLNCPLRVFNWERKAMKVPQD